MSLAGNERIKRIKRSLPGPLVGALKYVDHQLFKLWLASKKTAPRLERPVFMIGCPRGGTTIAVELLGAHPHVANWSEAGRVWDPVSYEDPNADHEWTADRYTEQEAGRLHALFSFRLLKTRKRVFVNKHPRNSLRITYIDRIFPDARFIHVVRDGRAVVNSVLREISRDPWRKNLPFWGFCKPPAWKDLLHLSPVEQTAHQWNDIVRYVSNHGEVLKDRFFEVRYEDLCKRPRAVVADMFRFAGLSSDEGILGDLPTELPNYDYKYVENLSPDEIALVESIQHDTLVKYGYI